MAVRMHVTAIRDTNLDAVRKTFGEILGEGFADVALVENTGWISFRTSVWQVSSSDLIKGLRLLNKPGLQFTTEDASRWYVTYCLPDREPESLVHQFGYHGDSKIDELYYANDDEDEYVDPELAFLEDETQLPSAPSTPFARFASQFSDLGAPLPQSLMKEVESLSFDQAIKKFQDWHKERFVGLLKSTGVHCNLDAVRRILSSQDITEVERDSDIGNLPRLLMVIGLGEEWETYIVQAEEAEQAQADPEFEEEDQEEGTLLKPGQLLAEVKQVIGSIEPSSLGNGPVELTMKDLTHLQFFPEACQIDDEIKTLLSVELRKPFTKQEFEQLLTDSNMARARCEKTPAGFEIGFENHWMVDWKHFRQTLGTDITRFIEQLPDHSRLTLSFAAEHEPSTRQLYQGEVVDQVWRIDATDPTLSASVLSDALSLAAAAPKTEHTLRDSAEANAVMEAAGKDSYLSGLDVQLDGNTVSCEYDVEFLAKIIFRIRFRDCWNVEPYEKHAEREYQQRIKSKWGFRRNAAKTARAQASPRIGDPIFQGEASVYWKSDLDHFKDLDPEVGKNFQDGMESLDFSLLGDLHAKRFRDYAVRCYVSPDRLAYADLTASFYGYLCWEFISDFSDGSRLTTTTLAMVFSRPAVKLYYQVFPNLDVKELYEKHVQLFEKFKKSKKASPMPLDPTLIGLAKAFDDTVVRTDLDEAEYEDDEDDYDEDDVDDE